MICQLVPQEDTAITTEEGSDIHKEDPDVSAVEQTSEGGQVKTSSISPDQAWVEL